MIKLGMSLTPTAGQSIWKALLTKKGKLGGKAGCILVTYKSLLTGADMLQLILKGQDMKITLWSKETSKFLRPPKIFQCRKERIKKKDLWAEGGTAMEKNAVYNSKKMLKLVNVNEGCKAYSEGSKVDLLKDLSIQKGKSPCLEFSRKN